MIPVLLLLLSLINVGCGLSSSAAAAAPDARNTVRVTRGQFGSSLKVRVGDVLKVERPADFDTWTVDFSSDVLCSLNTAEGRRTPPADGWTFAVVRSGTTDLVCTAHAAAGGNRNVPRFVLSITAE